MAEEPAKKSKRKVRNPETFRERAIKAAENEGRPLRTRRLGQAAGKVGRPVIGTVGRTGSKVAAFKPFRIFRRPLRLLGRLLWPKYLRNSFQELKLVKWPNWPESRRLTVAVLIFAIIFGATIAGVDYVLDKIFRKILLS